jgi:hypothetical protein
MALYKFISNMLIVKSTILDNLLTPTFQMSLQIKDILQKLRGAQFSETGAGVRTCLSRDVDAGQPAAVTRVRMVPADCVFLPTDLKPNP